MAMTGIIVRVWHGRTPLNKAAEYSGFLNQRAIADYRATPENLGAFVLERREADCAHFLTVSLWPSMKAIEAFAGSDLERAKYYEEDKDYLLEFEATVAHYTITGSCFSPQGVGDLWRK